MEVDLDISSIETDETEYLNDMSPEINELYERILEGKKTGWYIVTDVEKLFLSSYDYYVSSDEEEDDTKGELENQPEGPKENTKKSTDKKSAAKKKCAQKPRPKLRRSSRLLAITRIRNQFPRWQ